MAQSAPVHGPLAGLNVPPGVAPVEGALVVLGANTNPSPSEGGEWAVGATDVFAVRVDSFTQLTSPENGGPYHIGVVYGRVFGSGIFDGHPISLKLLESAVSLGGPFSSKTPLTGHPDYVFPATATAGGSAFAIPFEPDSWIWNSLAIRVTVEPSGQPDEQDTNYFPSAWDPNIVPDTPAAVNVPLNDSDGNFSIDWTPVAGASGYEVAEGVEFGESFIWGGWVDVGDTGTLALTGKASDRTYWYRVRAYNPKPNTGPYRQSLNGCLVERPTIYVTPDLGWSSREAMLTASANPAVGSFPIDELEVTTDPALPVKNRNTLVFTHDGINYKLPPGSISKIGGAGRCFWRSPNSEIQEFTLETRQPAAPADPVARKGPGIL